MSLTEEQALRAYAIMMNTLDASQLEPLLADDIHCASQWVFAEIESKTAYLAYMVQKLEAIRNIHGGSWTEIGRDYVWLSEGLALRMGEAETWCYQPTAEYASNKSVAEGELA